MLLYTGWQTSQRGSQLGLIKHDSMGDEQLAIHGLPSDTASPGNLLPWRQLGRKGQAAVERREE